MYGTDTATELLESQKKAVLAGPNRVVTESNPSPCSQTRLSSQKAFPLRDILKRGPEGITPISNSPQRNPALKSDSPAGARENPPILN